MNAIRNVFAAFTNLAASINALAAAVNAATGRLQQQLALDESPTTPTTTVLEHNDKPTLAATNNGETSGKRRRVN